MLFHNYLEKIFGSKIKVKIVRTMLRFPGKTFTTRELASFIKSSHTAVLKSIDDLEGMNLINIEKHGTANLLNLNNDSILYNNLKRLFIMEKDTIKRLKKIFSNIPAKTVAIFGSIAKEKEEMNSDIDLLVITNNKNNVNRILINKQYYISKTFGNVLRPYILTENEFKKKKNLSLIKNIIKNHIIIKGSLE